MKTIWNHRSGLIEFSEQPEPFVQSSDEVKIKVIYSTIGIQDLRLKRQWDFYSKEGVAGYEMAGVITGVGSLAQNHGWQIGQAVSGTVVQFCGKCQACKQHQEQNCLQLRVKSGTLCPYIVWKDDQLVHLPTNISFAAGCLLEPVAVVKMAYNKLHVNDADRICILGGDFNGLVLLQLIKLYTQAFVVIVENKAKNKMLAQKFGADQIIDPLDTNFETELLKLSDFIGFNKTVLTTSKYPELISTMINSTARGGLFLTTVYFDQQQQIAINSIKFFAMNLTIMSSFLYTKKLLQNTATLLSQLDLKSLICREFSFSAALTAYSIEQKRLYPRIGIKVNDPDLLVYDE
ncbi:alcohol dehydrogenase catalytic domain-containing protein [Liquorilactobacillus ghanensis]|jgi:threonine dehydrogenase-like Zn-dependent dehydrogenase|uniref:alcohol dehydrogenase catalytic domain-containing protein n=1 Tax=Liquorilactobacillus ghanensis TaxID=399370 RepID=UPI00070C1EB3|nr:alcohol dehydrogenase catalytic domain-containing protein [Liquorilactobacillus ghanensis]